MLLTISGLDEVGLLGWACQNALKYQYWPKYLLSFVFCGVLLVDAGSTELSTNDEKSWFYCFQEYKTKRYQQQQLFYPTHDGFPQLWVDNAARAYLRQERSHMLQ